MDRSAMLERGARQIAAGDPQAAEATYRAMLEFCADDREALSNLAATLNQRECHEAAEAAARAALQAHPGHSAALAALGVALHRQQRQSEAVAAYVAALHANPTDADTCSNLGVALNEQWRMQEALAVHDAAVVAAPQDPVIRSNRAMARLIAGDLAGGFAEFEWRWRVPGMVGHGAEAPQWTGEPLEGRTILVHDEGGFGDTLQFVRYVPALLARGARVVLQVQAPLVRLMRRSFPGVAQVIARGAPLPAHDLHCPMISLAHGFATTLSSVPAQIPYLRADPAAAALWQDRLRRLDAAGTPGGPTVEPTVGLTVGLVWAGAARAGQSEVHAMDRRRSMELARLAPLAGVSGVRYVSLQLGAPSVPPPCLALYDPMALMGDFDDTAALVSALDLVISVDTAVAHLAGALGRPVWVMSRHDACWRWLAHRRDSPWYPSLAFYRQEQPGEWDGVVASVAADLAALSQACAASARLSPTPSRAA